jgi:hypothetical protein
VISCQDKAGGMPLLPGCSPESQANRREVQRTYLGCSCTPGACRMHTWEAVSFFSCCT